MNLAMIVSVPLPPREGIAFYAWNLARQLTDWGHTVQMLTRGHAAPLSRQALDGFTIWRVPFFPCYPYHVHLHNLFVEALLRRLEPELDLVHLHSPLVRFPRTRLPTLVTVHTPLQTANVESAAGSMLGWLIRLQTPVSVRLETELFACADRIAAVSGSVAEALSGYGIASHQVAVLGNGVDTTFFCPSTASVSRKPPYFLTVGRLAPGKGLEDLLQCARIVRESRPDVRFKIAGSGPLQKTLRADIQGNGLAGTVELLGHVSDRKELLGLYRGAVACLHPSHYEGLPTAILEAMACGRPVVATAVGGTLDLLDNGVTGFLVPPRRPAEMADAILHLLGQPDLGNKVGVAGRTTILRRYSWEVVSRNYIREYSRLLETGAE